MSPFEEMFWTARDHAIYNGRVPVVALLGPQEWRAMIEFLRKVMGNDPRLQEMFLTDTWFFCDVPLRRMRTPGVAVKSRMDKGGKLNMI